MYWIVYALFTSLEVIADMFVTWYYLVSFVQQLNHMTYFYSVMFIHSFIHSFGLNNTVQDIKVTKTLTYVLGLNTKHQHDIVR